MARPPSAVSDQNILDLVALASTAPPGPIVEIGVWQGGTAYALYQLAEQQGRELHLFDTFKGMPVVTAGLDLFPLGAFPVEKNTTHSLQLLLPKAKLHIGVYPETHPIALHEVAFIHCDCDQYLSYRAVIDVMWPLVKPGGMMLFDDYPYLPGAKKAVDDSFATGELHAHGEHFYVLKT
jgi:O-methyltransferase